MSGPVYSIWTYTNFLYHFFISGDLMDILALINSAINFILYCAMSLQFRETFKILFRPKILDRWIQVPQNDDNQNGSGAKDNNGCVTQISQV